jgi:hypothetical protein
MSDKMTVGKCLRVVLLLVTVFLCILASVTIASALDKPMRKIQEDENNPAVVRRKFQEKIDSDSLKLLTRLKIPRSKVYKDDKGDTSSYTYTSELLEGTKYDITKTDSIVTPYKGTVHYKINWYANGKDIGVQQIIATYGYQDGNWILKDAYRDTGKGKRIDSEDELRWVSTLFE